jgi:hypothetical protein
VSSSEARTREATKDPAGELECNMPVLSNFATAFYSVYFCFLQHRRHDLARATGTNGMVRWSDFAPHDRIFTSVYI